MREGLGGVGHICNCKPTQSENLQVGPAAPTGWARVGLLDARLHITVQHLLAFIHFCPSRVGMQVGIRPLEGLALGFFKWFRAVGFSGLGY